MSTFEPLNFTLHRPETLAVANALVIPESQRNAPAGDSLRDRHMALPEGVNRVMVEWNGTADVRIRYRKPGTPQSDIGPTVKPGTLTSFTLPFRAAGGVMWLELLAPNLEPVDVADASVTVIPGPPVGAGGGSLRKVLGSARRLVAGWAK